MSQADTELPPILWSPVAERVANTHVDRFRQRIEQTTGVALADYAALYDWSIGNLEDFWLQFLDYAGVVHEGSAQPVLVDADKMPGASWFPQMRLSYAENMLQRRDDTDAIVFRGEDQVARRLSFNDVYLQVARLAQAMRELGVTKGDRVVGYLPNMPETIIAMLATNSIGAIWSSCSPDFGVKGVLDRFGQVEPVMLFSADGYFYNGKSHASLPTVAELREKLPTLKQVVIIPYTQTEDQLSTLLADSLPGAASWASFTDNDATEVAFERLPFDHPLFIMFSSGTTGVPKCIVHGAGGTLLQHRKEHMMHTDLHKDDRLFYFTTCGWMMWNWLVTGMAGGATLMLYDGSPFYPDGNVLFDYAEAENFSIFGTSAKFIDAASKAGIRPVDTHKLPSLRAVLSTGSPLVAESFDYVYDAIKADICLSSVSGGTDILGCFIIGCPALPVYRGELQCRALAMAVEVYDDDGKPVIGEKGELVCVRPFPSMPTGFWNDPEGSKYHEAYFAQYDNIWCHGDYVELTERGTMIIYGRSDAVLNPGGVRIGTAEIYRQVEQLDEVVEGLVVGQNWDNDVRVVLFVRLREGLALDEDLIARIRQQIRANTTPRHVPAKVLQVADIPRTKSGKIVELAVRNIIHGQPVKNRDALANPEALALFENRPEHQN